MRAVFFLLKSLFTFTEMLVSVHHHSRIWDTCLQQCVVLGIVLYVGFNEYVNQPASLLIGSLLDTRFAKEMKLLITK